MKNFYLAATVKKDGMYYSHIIIVGESDNLLSVLKRYGNLRNAIICPTKKRAVELVNIWNDSYRNNGTHMFDSDPDAPKF